jgi:hypothetical protein
VVSFPEPLAATRGFAATVEEKVMFRHFRPGPNKNQAIPMYPVQESLYFL